MHPCGSPLLFSRYTFLDLRACWHDTLFAVSCVICETVLWCQVFFAWFVLLGSNHSLARAGTTPFPSGLHFFWYCTPSPQNTTMDNYSSSSISLWFPFNTNQPQSRRLRPPYIVMKPVGSSLESHVPYERALWQIVTAAKHCISEILHKATQAQISMELKK